MTRFALDVSGFVRRAKAAPETVVRKVSIGLLSDIVLRTPVDTGRARASWNVGLNRIDADATVTITDKDGNRTIHRGLAELSAYRPDDDVFIFSRLPYIVPLEFGHSKQAPQGMVRLAVVKWHDHLQDAVRNLPK